MQVSANRVTEIEEHNRTEVSRTLRGIEQNIFTEIEEQTYGNRGTEQNEYVIFVFAIS